MSATLLYLVGYVIFVIGIAYGAHLMGVSPQWTGTTVVILLGLGIAMAATKTRHREPPGET